MNWTFKLWLLFSCVVFNKYHTFMDWLADRSNESNLDLSNLRSKYLRAWQAVAVELWLFLWLWVKRPPGNSMLGPPHHHLVHTYTDWGKGQSWGQTIFRGKVSCCNIISSYYALGHTGKTLDKNCVKDFMHIYAGCLWIIQEGSITITFGEWKLFMSESIVCREQLGLWLTLAVARGWEACSREKSTRIFGYLSCIHKRGGGKPCHLFRK